MKEDAGALPSPWAQSLLICEQVLVAPDDVPTLVRVVDTVAVRVQELNQPPVMPPVRYPLVLALVLRARAPTRGILTLTVISPDGSRHPLMADAVAFDGTPPVYRATIRADFIMVLPGLYWIDLAFEGRSLTRAPLEVTYEPPPAGGESPM